MKRRTLLRAATGAGAVGGTALSGCLGTVDDALGGFETDPKWHYDGGGRVVAVADGTLVGRLRYEEELETQREVVALDTDTGALQWRHGPISELSSFSALVVEDGIYVSVHGDDGGGQRLYAYDIDGDRRWTRNGRGLQVSVVAGENTVYAGYGGHVRALDAATGETRWERSFEETRRTPYGYGHEGTGSGALTDETVYLRTISSVLALDRSDGSTRWRYGTGEDRDFARDVLHSDGVTYVVTSEDVAAVSDGTEQWRTAFDGVNAGVESKIIGIAAGRLFVLAQRDVADEFDLHAFDLANGERVWAIDEIESGDEWDDPGGGVKDDVVYVGAGTLRALDAATGDERWQATAGDERVRSASVVEDGTAEDHAVFAHGKTHLASFAPDGRRTWEGEVDGTIRNLVVNDSVYVGTDAGTVALDWTGDS